MASSKKESKAMKIDIGISHDDRAKIVDGLSRLLADHTNICLNQSGFSKKRICSPPNRVMI